MLVAGSIQQHLLHSQVPIACITMTKSECSNLTPDNCIPCDFSVLHAFLCTVSYVHTYFTGGLCLEDDVGIVIKCASIA